MAVLNILAKSSKSITWDKLLNQYSNLNSPHIEIFPIPKELGFDEDCIGINVQNGYLNKEIVISELKLVIEFFASYNLKFIELYDGLEVTQDNIVIMASKLLPAPKKV